jgi:hypothetical protein
MNLVVEEPKFKVLKSYEDNKKKKTFVFAYTSQKSPTEVKRRVGRPRKYDY